MIHNEKGSLYIVIRHQLNVVGATAKCLGFSSCGLGSSCGGMADTKPAPLEIPDEPSPKSIKRAVAPIGSMSSSAVRALALTGTA